MNAIGTQLRDKLVTDPMAYYGGLKEKNGRRRGTREESRK